MPATLCVWLCARPCHRELVRYFLVGFPVAVAVPPYATVIGIVVREKFGYDWRRGTDGMGGLKMKDQFGLVPY